MIENIKKLSLALLLLTISMPLAAQEITTSVSEQGKIVMTKSQLKTFLEKIVQAKKDKLEQERLLALQAPVPMQQQRCNPCASNTTTTSAAPSSQYEQQLLLREIEKLGQRIDQLTDEVNRLENNKESITVIRKPKGVQNTEQQMRQEIVKQEVKYISDSSTLKKIQMKIDSLANLKKNLPLDNSASFKKDFDELNQKIAALQAQLNQPKEVEIKKEAPIAFKQQFFFANNVSDIKATDMSNIKNIANALRDEPSLNVVLKGFASTKGNPSYNNKLSMLRTETVKRALMAEGVSPAKIITIHYGEDPTASQAFGRRVDVTFITEK